MDLAMGVHVPRSTECIPTLINTGGLLVGVGSVFTLVTGHLNSWHRQTVGTDRRFRLLWPPYVTGQAIIFLQWFFLSSFFPRLISAVGDWMSTILSHMVWP